MDLWARSPRFLIFAQGRSGSTLLTELLGSSPDVHCDKEILAQWAPSPAAVIRAHRFRQRGRVYGYKVKIYQLTDEQGVDDVSAWLRSQWIDGWKIIALRRRNVVRQVLSNMEANRRGAFHQRGEEPPREPLAVDAVELVHWANLRLKVGEAEDAALAGIPHLALTYEDDLLDADRQQATLDRLLAWLGVPSAIARTSLRRINDGPVASLVANPDEVHRALVDADLERFWD